MSSASALRLQIESALAAKIPSALTPQPKLLRPVAPTGIPQVDQLIGGGLPLGAISELAGPEGSGRTSLALAFLAGLTQTGRVCAWVDVSDALCPESAAAAGVRLDSLLWVRCGVTPSPDPVPEAKFRLPEACMVAPPVKKGLHGGGFGPHPRTEANGLAGAIPGLLRPNIAARCAEPQRKARPVPKHFDPQPYPARKAAIKPAAKPWPRLEQALRVTDWLLQAGGFSAVVLDMGSLTPDVASRVPLATWFRYRAAVESSQSSLVLLTQHPCAKSSAGLVLRLESEHDRAQEPTIFTGLEHRLERTRERFAPDTTARKPPHRAQATQWQSRTPWAGRR